MKLILLAVIMAVSLTALRSFAAEDKSAAADANGKKLYHVVVFKFKQAATKVQIDEVVSAFDELPKKIPTITSYAAGTDVSPEKRAKGFTHCFVLTFASEKDRDAYAIDPAHKAFGALVGPVVDDVFVIDFWSGAAK